MSGGHRPKGHVELMRGCDGVMGGVVCHAAGDVHEMELPAERDVHGDAIERGPKFSARGLDGRVGGCEINPGTQDLLSLAFFSSSYQCDTDVVPCRLVAIAAQTDGAIVGLARSVQNHSDTVAVGASAKPHSRSSQV